jgi:hypothetical protein
MNEMDEVRTGSASDGVHDWPLSRLTELNPVAIAAGSHFMGQLL